MTKRFMVPVSFEVAKAIKNTGYPQGNTDKCYLTADHNQFYKEGQIVDNTDGEWAVLTKNLADIPTYLEVWLWLWRNKNVKIHKTEEMCFLQVRSDDPNKELYQHRCISDPEEAIIAAIEYLVENNII